MKPQKLQHQTTGQASEMQQQAQGLTARNALEFSSAEELLRHDAAQTVVPPAVQERLIRSLALESKPPEKRGWRRFFS